MYYVLLCIMFEKQESSTSVEWSYLICFLNIERNNNEVLKFQLNNSDEIKLYTTYFL